MDATLDTVFKTKDYIRLNPEGVLGNVAALLAKNLNIENKAAFLNAVRNPKQLASESEALTLMNNNLDILSELTSEGEAQLVCALAVTLSKTFQSLGLEVTLKDILEEVTTIWLYSRKEA